MNYFVGIQKVHLSTLEYPQKFDAGYRLLSEKRTRFFLSVLAINSI